MKTFNHTFICILICLVPALLAGQALQVQNQLPGISSPTVPSSSQNYRLTDPPLLRLSNTGASGMDGIKIELIPFSLEPTGPMLLFNRPDPLVPGTISLLPYFESCGLTMSGIGSSGQDGVKLNFGMLPAPDSFFDIFYNVATATETHVAGDPDFDLLFARTFDKATPKLHEHISSNNPGMNSFFDVFYDLPMGKVTHAYGDPDFDLLRITTYDKATPKLLERVTSTHMGLDSFFDVFYDLSLATTGTRFGFEPNDICLVHKFENNPPRLYTKVQSSDPLYVNSFFDITYDIALASLSTGFGNNPDNLCMVTMFDTVAPKLIQKVSSGLASTPSFFDITYDLSLERETRRFARIVPEDPDFDLLLIREYDRATPKLLERISSSNPDYAESFFDITYNLDLGSIRTEHNQNAFTVTSNEAATICWRAESMLPATPQFFDICYDMDARQAKITMEDLLVTRTFDSATPKLTERIQSSLLPYVESFFDVTYDLEERAYQIHLEDLIVSTYFLPEIPKLQQTISSLDPMMLDHFFDITYDLDLGKHATKHMGLVYAVQYRESDWDFSSRISSEDPTVPGFFDINYDIGLGDLLTHSTRGGVTGEAPLEMRYEYDGLNRLIREVSLDVSTGAMLMMERNLSPSSPRLVVGGGLRVNGGPISSDAGPLLVMDDIQMVGAMVINGSLQVNGPKAFRIDHPLDPENKYLFHSCIESPDMMNVYNGNIMTDENGFATVKLPDYFEALNKDFRYQLTCIGQFAQAIIDQKVSGNMFVIRTDKPGVEVSWQVTGIRQDPAALNSGYAVEVEKAEAERGHSIVTAHED